MTRVRIPCATVTIPIPGNKMISRIYQDLQPFGHCVLVFTNNPNDYVNVSLPNAEMQGSCEDTLERIWEGALPPLILQYLYVPE